jgi:hypothetical protein
MVLVGWVTSALTPGVDWRFPAVWWRSSSPDDLDKITGEKLSDAPAVANAERSLATATALTRSQM